jgi:hypothetical protein
MDHVVPADPRVEAKPGEQLIRLSGLTILAGSYMSQVRIGASAGGGGAYQHCYLPDVCLYSWGPTQVLFHLTPLLPWLLSPRVTCLSKRTGSMCM